MRTNEYNYPYTTVRENPNKKWDGSIRNGFYYKEYKNKGDWSGDNGYFSRNKPTNDPKNDREINSTHQTIQSIGRANGSGGGGYSAVVAAWHRIAPNSTYVFEADLINRADERWYRQFRADIYRCRIQIYINDELKMDEVSYDRGKDPHIHEFPNRELKKIKVIVGTRGHSVAVMLSYRRRFKWGRDWHWGHYYTFKTEYS